MPKKTKSKLFEVVLDEVRKSAAVLVRFSAHDLSTIRESARVHNLSTSEFLRRAGLGRRADVDHESRMVLALSDSTRAIRALHASMLDLGIEPPEELLRSAILAAGTAILVITDSV